MNSLKKLVIATILFAVCGFVQAQNNVSVLFSANNAQLSKYLELTDYQVNQVNEINDYFIFMQEEVALRNPQVRAYKMKKILFTNLNPLKEVLPADQYRKYVALINVTHNNKIAESPINGHSFERNLTSLK